MAPSLRQRRVCFYCGRRSAEKAHSTLRNWKCTNCEAVNHLDENGEITHPPVLESVSAVQYAHSVPRATSPTSLATTEETLFCPTCLQNQHLLTQMLASYLPSIADGNDADYESQYPRYRARLEEQYPQVCGECAPRVSERIRATGYAAKTDHLRRMMERTREIREQRGLGSWGWQNAVVMAGSLGWWSSLAGQAVWNIMGAMVNPDDEDGLRAEEIEATLPTCLHQYTQVRVMTSECAALAAPIAGLALVLGIISIWWNNRLSEKSRVPGCRMVGLKEYYKLQVVVLMARIGAWMFLKDGYAAGLSLPALRAAHLFMLAFITISSILSLRIVEIDRTPKVSWQESPESLTRLQPPAKAKTLHGPSTATFTSQSNRFSNEPTSYIQAFPITNLAPVSQQAYPPPYNPPTPPPDDEPDAMDWTPTQSSFQPAPIHSISQKAQITSTASPFYGRIPSAPQSQAQRLRNPQNQPSFRKTPAEKQQNFFDSMTRRVSPQQYPQNPERLHNDSETNFEMAPPKFFPRDDSATDTVLVSLFDSAFSLKDEPPEIQAARERQQQLSYRPESWQDRGAWARIGGICSLGAAWLLWKAAGTMPSLALYFRLGALGVSATVACFALLEATGKSKAFWSLSDMLLFVTELAASVFLVSMASTQNIMPDAYETLGMILFGGMMVQEMVGFVSSQKHLPRQSTATAPPLLPSPKQSSSDPVPPAITPPARARAREPPVPVSPLQLQLREPRMTRSRSKRESFIPSTSLSGLSLGTERSDYGSPSETSSISTTYDDMRFQPESPVARRQLRTQRGLGAFGVNRR